MPRIVYDAGALTRKCKRCVSPIRKGLSYCEVCRVVVFLEKQAVWRAKRIAARQAKWRGSPVCLACGCHIFRTYHSKWCAQCFKAQERARKRKIRKRVRAAILAGLADRIDPTVVFERAGWRCQICGKATPEDLRGTYDLASPELDHVIALAAGGTHTWGNVQCACRDCNRRKGAGPSPRPPVLYLTG